jgi:hypothetical protein
MSVPRARLRERGSTFPQERRRPSVSPSVLRGVAITSHGEPYKVKSVVKKSFAENSEIERTNPIRALSAVLSAG